jgi:CubicO group peptidase (beta-lactamase class C family)
MLSKIFVFMFVIGVNVHIAKAQSIDRKAILAAMTDSVLKDKTSGIHSILIANGDTVDYATYFGGFTTDSLHDSRSSFKSITSLLVAIALGHGMIKNTRQKVLDFFPEYAPFKNDNKWKKSITIQHLLDMRSGFDCEEFNNTKDCETSMSATDNWVKYSLDLPMKTKPGTLFSYTSCNPMILSGVISNAAHMSVMDFAAKYLFGPLGNTHYKWTVDPSGNGMTGGSFYILPEDMLKIGQMVRDGGKWKGKQIISKKSLDHATKADKPIPDFSFAKASKSRTLVPQQTFYGGFWYREEIKTKTLNEQMLFASGNGGQYIFIINRLNLVVVFTQGNYGSWKAKKAFELLGSYILPAYSSAPKTNL